ncbi:hypothetical protein LP419_01500 [Massilia sp. H-1]|nr:hypothetical protein LP419_01500 [Massilia sp. H-1]
MKNNVVYRVVEGAIHLWHDANNVIITNNTVAASNTGIIVGGGDYYRTRGPADYIQVYSNIVYDNKMGISEQGKTGTHNSYRNNLVSKNSTYDWRLFHGLDHSGTVSSAPLFKDYDRSGTPDLSLSASSLRRSAAVLLLPRLTRPTSWAVHVMTPPATISAPINIEADTARRTGRAV